MRTYRTVNLNVLWFLIALCAAVFAIELAVGGYPIVDQYGYVVNYVVKFLGLERDLLAQHPWTIITAIFVHGGFAHIIFNMISLYFLGSLFLRVKGEGSFLAVFFLGGLAGNALFLLLAAPNELGVGASGAIFAIGGALAVLVPRVPVYIFFIPIAMPLWLAIVIFLALSFLFAGIAWQAHLGGVLAGVIAGFLFRRKGQFHYF
jgi:membrane associated rhomboid family serine protease